MTFYREYLDKAYDVCRQYISPQTGYIHVHPEIYTQGIAQTAPVEENFLYALLLLRKKTHESLQEGRERLKKLLFFQNREKDAQHGNFPVLLTDYPSCTDWVLPLRLLLIYASIFQSFSHILGKDLLKSLEESQHLLLDNARKNAKQIAFPSWAKIAFSVFSQEEHSTRFEMVDAFFENLNEMAPKSVAFVLLSAYLIDKGSLFTYAFCKAKKLCRYEKYIGPSWGIFSFKEDPEVTLFDLIMNTSSFLKKELPYQTAFSYALAMDHEEIVSQDSFEDQISSSVQIHNLPYASIAVVSKPPRTVGLYGFHPLRIVFPHATLVIHTPHEYIIDSRVIENGFEARFSMEHAFTEDTPLCTCFLEHTSKTPCTIQGSFGTVFDPRQGLEICEKENQFRLQFFSDLECMGRLSLHNRPGQLYTVGKSVEKTPYDWKIAVYPLRGNIPATCMLRLTLCDPL